MRYPILTALLSPILVAQGLATRRNTPLLPEPPGERRGRRGSGPKLKLLIAGDSAAAGVGSSHQDEALLGQVVSRLSTEYEVEWDLQANTGDTTAATLERLDKLPPESFDVAVTSLGVNDVTKFTSRSRFRVQQSELRDMLRRKFDVTTLIISGLPPLHGFPALPQPLRWHMGSRATQLDSDLATDVAGDPDSLFLSLRFTEDTAMMASDGFHPGPAVYAEWGRRVADLITENRNDPVDNLTED